MFKLLGILASKSLLNDVRDRALKEASKKEEVLINGKKPSDFIKDIMERNEL